MQPVLSTMKTNTCVNVKYICFYSGIERWVHHRTHAFQDYVIWFKGIKTFRKKITDSISSYDWKGNIIENLIIRMYLYQSMNIRVVYSQIHMERLNNFYAKGDIKVLSSDKSFW